MMMMMRQKKKMRRRRKKKKKKRKKKRSKKKHTSPGTNSRFGWTIAERNPNHKKRRTEPSWRGWVNNQHESKLELAEKISYVKQKRSLVRVIILSQQRRRTQ